MTPRGPKPNPRYAGIPARCAIYAAEFGNGIVKVGRTFSARARIQALAAEASRVYGCDLVRFHIGGELRSTQALYTAETAALSRVRAYGDAVPGRSEYFQGLSFDVACLAVEIASAKFAPKPSQRRIEGADPSINLRACHDADAHFFADF